MRSSTPTSHRARRPRGGQCRERAPGSGVISTASRASASTSPRDRPPERRAAASSPACSNLADDDGDGAVDMGDPGCSGPLDGDESNPRRRPRRRPTLHLSLSLTAYASGGGAATARSPATSAPRVPAPPATARSTSAGRRQKTGGTSAPSTATATKGNGGVEPPARPAPARRHPDASPTRPYDRRLRPAPIGVPNFIIDSFEIPPFLLPIYQACGTQYGIPWQVLAAINKIETAFGTNLNVSTAGAMGWMQFIPSTWEAYGVDANGDGRKDPYNPVDAICAAARYLRAAGGDQDLRTAIFAYNHADWYVDEVLRYAQPVRQAPRRPRRLADRAHRGRPLPDRRPRPLRRRHQRARSRRVAPAPQRRHGNVADVIAVLADAARDQHLLARGRAGRRGQRRRDQGDRATTDELGNYIVLQDTYGNRFTYARLGSIAKVYPVPEAAQQLTAQDFKLVSPHDDDAQPNESATGGGERPGGGDGRGRLESPPSDSQAEPSGPPRRRDPVNTEDSRDRLYALPERPQNIDSASLSGQLDELLAANVPGYETVKNYLGDVLRFDSATMNLRPLQRGLRGGGRDRSSAASAGPTRLAPHINFSISPVGRGAPRDRPEADPRRLEAARVDGDLPRHRQEPVHLQRGRDVSQILLMSKDAARAPRARRPAALDLRLRPHRHPDPPDRPPRPGGARVPRRVGLPPHDHLAQVRSQLLHDLGHDQRALLGRRGRHRDGQRHPDHRAPGPGLDHRGGDPAAHAAAGDDAPAQIISLMDLGGPSFAMSDHYDHIHVGYTRPVGDGQPWTRSAVRRSC